MPKHDLRLLALDGGGVRGLSTLQILKQLMDTINPESPPKPCDCFDMIGGTSTGGLIAIMLGRLRMTVDECIDAYISLWDRTFQKQRHPVTIKGRVQGRFNSDELEHVIKEIIARQGLAEDALLKDALDARCKVFVCATSSETGDTVRLTSYHSPRGRERLLRTTKIWEAGRATLAASSFFDPVTIGDFKESFGNGATRANNPVYELWNEAQDIWIPGSLKDKIKCLVSIGTGIPSLAPFNGDLIDVGRSLLAIATETEKTARRFSHDRSGLEDIERYYRFNVLRGLEDIGLEDSKQKNAVIAATDRYFESRAAFKQLKACANNMSVREDVGSYRTPFSLQGVPVVNNFVDRPSDMAKLEQTLLPRREHRRRKVFVLHGLGGIGKTQLAVEFARRHHRKFSSVFWLDGRTEDSLKQSIATCASRIPEGQIAKTSRAYSATSTGDVDAVVRDVMSWLSRPDNTDWLIIFDNVDRKSQEGNADPDAYDVVRYLSGADHGSVLVTTRLAGLEQLGGSWRVGSLSMEQAQAMFENRYGGSCDPVESEELLKLLDGLPLAIAQASAYLRQSGIGVARYIKLYEQQWKGLMESQDGAGMPLQDYPERSIWTTWTISYDAIRAKNMAASNLLLLWACLDNNDMWYGLLADAGIRSTDMEDWMSEWLPNIANDEVGFITTMQLLRSYSLVEGVQDLASYTIHPVVHKWAFHIQDEQQQAVFTQLAVAIVGWAVPGRLEKEYSSVQRRLLPHAQRCWQWVIRADSEHRSVMLGAMHGLGMLYADQGKLGEAEKMYERALEGREKELGREHTSTLDTVNNLGNLYADQGKLGEAEKMFERALEGYEKVLGREHISTLSTVNNLGNLYENQGKLGEAEKMYKRALEGKEKALGPDHTLTLNTVHNLGNLYADQGKLGEAGKMYKRALEGYKKAFGQDHISTLNTVSNLGILYANQGKLNEAEKMYKQALEGYKKALGPDHMSTLNMVNNLGNLYADQGKLGEAEKMYKQALEGYKKALGPDHTSTLSTVNNLGNLYADQGKLNKAEKMYQRALQGYEKAIGTMHISTLSVIGSLGNLYKYQGELSEAEKMYQRALEGYEMAIGLEHTLTLSTVNNLGLLYADQGKLSEAEGMYQRALEGKKKALGPDHISTLDTVNNLGLLYTDQGKLDEAEEMFQQALEGYERALGPEHISTLDTVKNLRFLYKARGKLGEVDVILERTSERRQVEFGLLRPADLSSINSLISQPKDQVKYESEEHLRSQTPNESNNTTRQEEAPSSEAEDTKEETSYLESPTTSDAGSIFSEVPESATASTAPSQRLKEMLASASDELVAIFFNDDEFVSMFVIAFKANNIGGERVAGKFSRLLKQFAKDLIIEAQNPTQKATARFVRSRANYVTQSIRTRYDLGYRFAYAFTGSNHPGVKELKKERLERYLLEQRSQQQSQRSQDNDFAIPPGVDIDTSKSALEQRADVDIEYVSSEDNEEPQEHNLRNLKEVMQFIVESKAYSTLREVFKEFVQLSSAKAPKVNEPPEAAEPSEVSEEHKEVQCPRGHTKLQNQYNKVIGMIEAALGNSESHKLCPQVAIALDDTLLRLELWEDELGSDEEQESGKTLEMVESNYEELGSTIVEALRILSQRIESLLEWQAEYIVALQRDDSELPVPSDELFENLSEALENLIDLSEIIRSQAEQRAFSQRIASMPVRGAKTPQTKLARR